MYNTAKDISGQKFGKWTVVSRAPKSLRKNSTPAMWNVRCECGTESVVSGPDLRSGRTKGCPCSIRGPQPTKIGKYSRDKHHAWKGGRSLDKRGYIVLSPSMVRDLYPNAVMERKTDVKKPRHNAMFEHRAVMSNFLKRSLHSNETVHHKNGNRQDNRLENLELKVGAHGPGMSVDEAVAWAKEILRRYA
jgi:hypothetical protein